MIKTLVPILAVAFALAPNLRAESNIVETAKSTGIHKTLVAAVVAGGKAEMLSDKGPYTVFAPTDEAFAALPKGTVEELLKPENKAKLGKILANHVVSGSVMSADIKSGPVTTAAGTKLDLETKDGGVMVGAAKVIKADVKTSNGVIHVIDKVLLPE